ncbi:hypothetical protein ACFYOV_25535 [Streptomyces sp. NPDC005931]|uniref:hypothetical protein n=1 Tax=Streptomyces sp. NPDC005931 TaxID=3364737 RepID=UPI0036907485
MRRTAIAAVCLAAVAATGLTGCLSGENTSDGTSKSTSKNTSRPSGKQSTPKERKPGRELFAGLTGGEIVERSVTATTGASSLRMKGDIPDDETGGTLRINMAMDKRGECAGTMGMGNEGEAELIKTGDTLYMKYDEAFLRAQSKGEPKADVDATVALLADQWTRMSATGPDAEDITGFCDLDEVLADMKDGESNATRGRTATVDGTPAIVLHEKDGTDDFTLYVATEGEPYLLRLDSNSPADRGSLTFSDFNEPVPAQKPSGDVLDLDSPS